MYLVEGRIKKLNLYGRLVGLIPYPRGDALKLFTHALVEFYPAFDPNLRSKSQMKKMPIITEFLTSSGNFRLTDYTLEYILCGKDSCVICVQIGRGIRTPGIAVGNNNLCAEVLGRMEFPVNNPM